MARYIIVRIANESCRCIRCVINMLTSAKCAEQKMWHLGRSEVSDHIFMLLTSRLQRLRREESPG